MTGPYLPAFLWGVAAALALGYAGLFLWSRRPAAIRLVRVGVALVIVVALRLALVAAGHAVEMAWEIVAGAGAIAVALGCLLARRAWLVRASTEEFRAFVAIGCGGLFIDWQEPEPGWFVLSAKQAAWQVRLVRITGQVQFAVVRPPRDQGKLALFVQWLSKQYPGPVPRIRIILHRSQP